jgi:glycosyltransferase involved in cell wall biosynthesis
MISLIICSRTLLITQSLEENITATIGAQYELIVIDNSDNKYSIFEAYNIGVAKSKYPYLCFMHDDINYHSENWGDRIIEHLEHEETGAIGIAGSPYAAKLPGSWWGGGLINQYIHNADIPKKTGSANIQVALINKKEVVLLDGVWFCIRRSLFDHISFDEQNYKGFHFYDLDISMQISQAGYKNYSIENILISHYSIAELDKKWCENAMIYSKKWSKILPVSSGKLTYAEQCDAELKTFKEYLYNLFYNNYPLKKIHTIFLTRILSFRKGFFYYKTPLFFFKYLNMIINYDAK